MGTWITSPAVPSAPLGSWGTELFFRVNGDSPFAAVELFPSAVVLADGADLVSNVAPRRLPPGATVELIRTEALAGCLDDMTSEDAEHVTAHLYRHRERFTVEGLPCPDLGFRPGDRLVVDDEEDLARARGSCPR